MLYLQRRGVQGPGVKAEACFLQSRAPFPQVKPTWVSRAIALLGGWKRGCASANSRGSAQSLAFRWVPGTHSRVGRVPPSMLSWGSEWWAEQGCGGGLVSAEGTSLAKSAGPWCIAPGCGFPGGCLRWLSLPGEQGRSMLAMTVSLPACEPLWTAAGVET